MDAGSRVNPREIHEEWNFGLVSLREVPFGHVFICAVFKLEAEIIEVFDYRTLPETESISINSCTF